MGVVGHLTTGRGLLFIASGRKEAVKGGVAAGLQAIANVSGRHST